MKKKTIISLSLLLLISCTLLWARWRPAQRFTANDFETQNFRILTWNVGYFAPTSNKNMKDLDINEVSKVLKATQAQVLILQELAKADQAKKIAAQLGKTWQAYSVKTGHGEQVISVLTPLKVLHEENIECGGRMAKGLRLRDKLGNLIYILGLHSPHPARGIQENKDSISQAINHTLKRPEKIRFIAGDFNYNFDPSKPNEFYKTITKDFGDGTIDLGETYYAHTRIDHIFHYPKELKVIKEESGMIDLSLRFAKVPGFRDHRPIVVSYDLQLKNKSQKP